MALRSLPENAEPEETEAAHKPASRRPIAEGFRRSAYWCVRQCVRWRIHPDAISYLSTVTAAAGAVCSWLAQSYEVLLLVAPVCLYARLWLNMLDGMVALAAGKASPRGDRQILQWTQPPDSARIWWRAANRGLDLRSRKTFWPTS